MRMVMNVAAGRIAARSRRISVVLGLVVALAAGGAAAQDDNTRIDGLNADLRGVLYNSGTSAVAKLDLTQLGHDQLVQTVHGLFDPSEYDIFVGSTKDFDTQLEQYLSPTKAAGALVELDYKTLTVAVLQGTAPFAALLLGANIDDATFATAQIAIQGVLSMAGVPATITRRGDYALISGAALPALPHTQSIEDAILLGLQQPTGTPAVVFVSPVDDALRAQLASGGSSAPDFAAAIGQADYIGGYLVTGANPQVHVYVRYGSDATANNVKALYDKAWQQEIAQADTEDANNKTSMIQDVSYISTGEMTRRIQAAMPVTVFNGIVKLDLDTVALRQITGAVIDRYFRKPASSDTPAPGAPADNNATTDSGGTAQ